MTAIITITVSDRERILVIFTLCEKWKETFNSEHERTC